MCQLVGLRGAARIHPSLKQFHTICFQNISSVVNECGYIGLEHCRCSATRHNLTCAACFACGDTLMHALLALLGSGELWVSCMVRGAASSHLPATPSCRKLACEGSIVFSRVTSQLAGQFCTPGKLQSMSWIEQHCTHAWRTNQRRCTQMSGTQGS